MRCLDTVVDVEVSLSVYDPNTTFSPLPSHKKHGSLITIFLCIVVAQSCFGMVYSDSGHCSHLLFLVLYSHGLLLHVNVTDDGMYFPCRMNF